LDNDKARAKYGLKKIENLAPSELFKEETSETGTYQWASLTTVISTKLGHQAISQSELVNNWNKDQRAFFTFQTKQAVRAIPAWLSVPYAALSQQTQGTTLNVYSPHKNEAAQINIKAMADTLTWFAENITPYTGAQLNLIATPDIGSAGYALPQLILIKDTVGFRARPSKNAGFDQRYRRAVHETAHQWFGHGIGNGISRDSSFLSESLAKYIELVILEKHYGEKAMLALVEIEQERYNLNQRNNMQSSVALIDATQEHDIHSRATLAFAKLRETVGDKPITAALKSLWLQHAYPNTPATSMDFVRALKRHSAVKNHPMINDLLLKSHKSIAEQ
jgi:aminopeptidase N